MHQQLSPSLSGAVARDRVREAIALAERERRIHGRVRRPLAVATAIATGLAWLVGR